MNAPERGWTRAPRWTEAQLFEPVEKWVEDAERGIGPRACAECDRPAMVRGLCVSHFNREQDRRARDGRSFGVIR